MRENISRDLKNPEIASYLSLSSSNFNHKFKQKTAVSPRTRMLEIIIKIAKGLSSKGKKLKEIAECTGFHDGFQPLRTFKNITGLSPGAFKNLN